MTAINIKNLEYTWPKSSLPTLQVPDFQVEKGESVFLRSDSGSSKSTLLSLISGILSAQSGRVSILGTDLAGLSVRKRDVFRAHHIGLVFQQFNLIPFLSVEANLRLAARFTGQPTDETRTHSIQLMSALQLGSELLERRADRLSIGQQQRVAIARAFINKPEIILADEPTSALDTSARDHFVDLLLAIRESSGCAIVFVSHDDSLANSFETQLELAEINTIHSRQLNHV